VAARAVLKKNRKNFKQEIGRRVFWPRSQKGRVCSWRCFQGTTRSVHLGAQHRVPDSTLGRCAGQGDSSPSLAGRTEESSAKWKGQGHLPERSSSRCSGIR